MILVVLLTAVVTGCGTRSQTARDHPAQLDPSRGDVATVGNEAITSDEVDAILDETAASFQALRRPFPEAGTPYYLDLRDEALQYLLLRSAREQEAERMGVSVDDADVDDEFDTLDQADLHREAQRMALTTGRVRTDIRDRQLLEALFAAAVTQKPENETDLEAMRAWDEQVNSKVRSAEFAPGWEPADEPRSPIPPELENLPDPEQACDLPPGAHTLREAAAHGCLGKIGIPIPGRTGKLCRDIPIRDFAVAGSLPDEGPYLEYQESLMDAAPSCSPYPETTVALSGDSGVDCTDAESLCYGARIDPREAQSPSRQ